MTVRLLDRRQLKAEKGLPNSKAHLHRVCRHPDPDQRFPQPVKVGNQSRWLDPRSTTTLSAAPPSVGL
jgi:predicted DNA-binding transcriptional regulator AlpA